MGDPPADADASRPTSRLGKRRVWWAAQLVPLAFGEHHVGDHDLSALANDGKAQHYGGLHRDACYRRGGWPRPRASRDGAAWIESDLADLGNGDGTDFSTGWAVIGTLPRCGAGTTHLASGYRVVRSARARDGGRCRF
ncbi:MAG: hypothetical protein ACRERD_06145 [Candidatus Binatia bacterium]